MKKIDANYLVRLSLLCAVLVVMSVTPLGYLNVTGLFSITFLTIPVIVAAITLGPGASAFLGLVFGVTSFINAFSNIMGQTFLSISPLYTLILCVVPRVLEGLLAGLIFKGLKKLFKKSTLPATLASISCPVLNTVLYMSSLVLLFGRSEYILSLRGGKNIFSFVVAFVGINAVVEAVVCGVLGALISLALIKVLKISK